MMSVVLSEQFFLIDIAIFTEGQHLVVEDVKGKSILFVHNLLILNKVAVSLFGKKLQENLKTVFLRSSCGRLFIHQLYIVSSAQN